MRRSLLTIMVILIGACTMFAAGYAYEIYFRGYDPVEELDLPEPTKVAEPKDNGVKAKDFTVRDIDGNEVKLSDFHGTPVVLNFWASWCDPCKGEMPGFQTVYESLEGEVAFVMVNLTDGGRETVASAVAFIEEQGYTFPIYFDTELDAAAAYGASSIPLTYFVDSQGYLISNKKGMMSEKQLQSGIDLIKSPRYYTITQEEVLALLAQDSDLILLDARDMERYAAGHLEGAISLPYDEILEIKGIEDLLPDPKQKIVVYCDDGRLSKVAAKNLQTLGYFAVYDMGGIEGWGDPLYQTDSQGAERPVT